MDEGVSSLCDHGDDRKQFRHERLEVWQASVDFAVDVYRLTLSFPPDERFALSNQLRRASVSVSSNIAEGNGRTSGREKVRFIEIAYGSLMEVMSQLEIAQRLNYINEEAVARCRSTAFSIARQLSALRSAIERRTP